MTDKSKEPNNVNLLIAYLLVKTHKCYQNQKNGKIKTLLGT